MTPQEFFKNDIFATKAGIVLLEVRKGYSKAKLDIKPEHLNAGARTQGGAIFTLADHLPQPPIHTAHSLSLFHLPLLSFVQAVREILFMLKHTNVTSVGVQVAIK